MALITGWDRSTWNAGAWNSPIPVEVTGVSAATGIGSVSILVPVTVTPSGVSAASGIGSPTLVTNSTLSVTGVSSASAVGSVQANFAFTVEGVSAEGLISVPNVWTVIDDSQTSNFSEISTTQTPNWTEIAA